MKFTISGVCLFVSDVQHSTKFYRDKLGFELKRLDTGFAEFHDEGTSFALWEAEDVQQHLGKDIISEDGHWYMGAFEFQTAEEVETACSELKDKGVNFTKEPFDGSRGAREAYFADPDGYLWKIYACADKSHTWKEDYQNVR
jgi:uncharacterized protein